MSIVGQNRYVWIKQVARLTWDQLVQRLGNSGYKSDKYAPNILSHDTHKLIVFFVSMILV